MKQAVDLDPDQVLKHFYIVVSSKTATRSHLVSRDSNPSFDRAVCGQDPAPTTGFWIGRGVTTERDKAKSLPICSYCSGHAKEVM